MSISAYLVIVERKCSPGWCLDMMASSQSQRSGRGQRTSRDELRKHTRPAPKPPPVCLHKPRLSLPQTQLCDLLTRLCHPSDFPFLSVGWAVGVLAGGVPTLSLISPLAHTENVASASDLFSITSWPDGLRCEEPDGFMSLHYLSSDHPTSYKIVTLGGRSAAFLNSRVLYRSETDPRAPKGFSQRHAGISAQSCSAA